MDLHHHNNHHNNQSQHLTTGQRRIQNILDHIEANRRGDYSGQSDISKNPTSSCSVWSSSTAATSSSGLVHLDDLSRLRSTVDKSVSIAQQSQPSVDNEIDLLRTLLTTPETRRSDQKIVDFLNQNAKVFNWRRTIDVSRREYQDIANDWTLRIAQSGIMNVERLRDAPAEFFSFFKLMGFFEHSLALKFAVQYSLWGSTILNLGTEKHHKRFLQRINTAQLPGIFGLTELGHGSNVRRMELTATYDRQRQEFIIHSPTPSAQKYWPGHIFRFGVMGTFFARLVIDNQDYGIHAFVVPVRDPRTKKLIPECHVRDLGPKPGYNGIDNGCLSFSNVRIPRENMLDRFSQVLPDGTYVNKVGDANRHFGSIMFALCGGRIVIGTLASSAAKMAVTIATRYAHHRAQFGPDNGPEVKLIEHVSYHCRLMPQLVRCFTSDLILKYATDVYVTRDKLEPNHTHIVTSLAKVHASSFAVEACRVARESCGGQGYRHINRIPQQYECADMSTVGEGDNIALRQTVVKALLSSYSRQRKIGKFSGLLEHLNDPECPHYKLDENVSLRSLDYLLDAFRFRERTMLLELVHRLDPGNSNTDDFERFNDNQVLIMQLSQAFMDRIAVQVCIQATDDAVVSSIRDSRQVISSVFELDGLQRFKDGLSWFLAHEYVLPGVARTIDDVHQELCRKVALVSYDLTKAFDIPQMCLPQETLVDNWTD